jgi:uncharacterized Zn-binding protein involved in type VI secretion
MIPPLAARVGDMTSHGSPLTPATPPGGSLNVFIGGRPAWRAGVDLHLCPLVNGVVPHVGGSVAVGSKSVFINGLPAARMGDVVVEGGGGPNKIAIGCETVIIGG